MSPRAVGLARVVGESLLIFGTGVSKYRFDSANLAWGTGELVVQGAVPAAVETGVV